MDLGVNMWGNLCLILFLSATAITGLKLTILHTNDVHARFEQFNKFGSECSQSDVDEGKCFGGVARRFTKIQEIRENHDNVLLLDAGDQFMGTTFFTVHQGIASAYFMNRMKYDAMCLGNHEFDLSVPPLAKFLDNVTFPVVSCNTDVTMENRLQGKFTKSTTITISGETIGLIGYITRDTTQLSAPGPTVPFGDIVDCVKAEVNILKGQGVNKIIALGHAGFDMDKRVATIDGVDIVVGGHTNTFLYNGEPPHGKEFEYAGPYPYTVEQAGGKKCLCVQNYKWGKYLGYLNVTFDENGVITEYGGNPITLDSSIMEDGEILQEVVKMKEPVTELISRVVGYSNVFLNGSKHECRLKECNMGNLITDAIIDYHVNYTHPVTHWAPAAIALWIAGSIRSSIEKGNITMGQVLTVLPYANEIDLVTVKGKNLREQLEVSVSVIDTTWPKGRFLQMSGMRVVYNLNNTVGKRVRSVEVRCLECDVPNYSPLQDDKDYKVFLFGFVLDGGDGYSFQPSSRERFNTLDYATLVEYLARHGSVYTGLEGRIRFEDDSTTSSTPYVPANFFYILLAVMAFALI